MDYLVGRPRAARPEACGDGDAPAVGLGFRVGLLAVVAGAALSVGANASDETWTIRFDDRAVAYRVIGADGPGIVTLSK